VAATSSGSISSDRTKARLGRGCRASNSIWGSSKTCCAPRRTFRPGPSPTPRTDSFEMRDWSRKVGRVRKVSTIYSKDFSDMLGVRASFDHRRWFSRQLSPPCSIRLCRSDVRRRLCLRRKTTVNNWGYAPGLVVSCRSGRL
jgi:hypothetical protein